MGLGCWLGLNHNLYLLRKKLSVEAKPNRLTDFNVPVYRYMEQISNDDMGREYPLQRSEGLSRAIKGR